MLSVQEIRDKQFEKTLFGGYDIKSVDDFIDEIIAEMAIMQKEKIALQQKLKDLSDKNEEYRAVENSMRRALISAQEIAAEMVTTAEGERDKILNEVKESAQEQINTYRAQIADEKEKLRIAKEGSSEFISKMTGYFETQLGELVKLSKEVPVVTDKDKKEFTISLSKENAEEMASIPDVEQTAVSITENIIEKLKRETINARTLTEETDETKVISSVVTEETPQEKAEEKPSFSSKYDVKELKFGKNFNK